MKLNLLLKILPIEIIFAFELKANQNFMKGLFFEFLSRILIPTLTFLRRITYIYIFKLLFS